MGVHLHAIDPEADSRPLFDPAHAVSGDHNQLRRPGYHRNRWLQPAKRPRHRRRDPRLHLLRIRLGLCGRANPRRLATGPFWLEKNLRIEHLHLVAVHRAARLRR
ncbi:hypothetical protein D3C72_1360230 [compost metagenome]